MDTTGVIAVGIAAAAAVVAWFFAARARALARAVDDARSRIGGSKPRRRWHRTEALDDALQLLERSSSQAQKERSRLAGALQAATIGIIVTDDQGVITFANQTADQYLGAREGEAVTEIRLRDAIEQAILNRTAFSTEVELFTPTRRILDVGAVPLDFGVESVGAVAYVREVTEQHRVRAMRRDFIANVSHELKTPLSALAILAETIAGNVNEPDIAERMAGRLRAEANRLNALVDDILDLSQAEALAAHDKSVPVSELVSAATDAVGDLANQHGVRLITESEASDAKVSGDRRQLRSMLVNLLDNAIKYSNPQPEDEPAKVWLRTLVDEDVVVLEIEDEGIGIPDSHIDRIFERFYRVERDQTGAAGGTGLGLSIAKHVALDHKGEVEVDSTFGEGSRFRVTLPRWKDG